MAKYGSRFGASLRSRVTLGSLLGLLAVVVGCAINPATGERQLSFMSEGQEIQMGRDADPDIVASMGLYPNQGLQDYVQNLGETLAAVSERPDLPWTFRVLDDPLINAFALPGGYIYVTRGIMAYLDSEAELVGVLGHEIGHVTARHSVNQMSRAQLAQIGLGVGMILAPEFQRFEGLASASMQLLFLKFGRDDETQSDELGVRYMSRIGYDPTQLSGVMAMLGRVTRGEGSEGPPEWLSTHPNPENREEKILAMASRAGGDATLVRREDYLRRLDGLVFGNDPREGFFRGEQFYHPGMAFQLRFPSGWATANSKQAVQAMSPEEDALMALTLGEGETPAAALRAFLSQEGMQAGQVSESSLNGIPAAAAAFRFTSSDGTLDGRVVFLQHQGTLLRLLGYGPTSVWGTRRDAVRSAMESFGPLRDPALLAVEPARLRILTVERATDLATLVEREGASQHLDQVRDLNRLEGNPSLSPGRILKIPVGGDLPSGD